MREENWYKMLIASAIFHVFLIGAFSIPLKKSFKRPDMSYYSVNLVGDIGASIPKAAPAAPVKAPPEPVKNIKKPEPKKPAEKERVVARPKEKTLAPVKKKDAPLTKDEVRTLDQRIRELKSRQYIDIAGKKEGPPGRMPGISGAGTPSGPVDPVLQKYYADIWEKIQESWHSPNITLGKGLLTVVSIKIRRDGRITDWTIEQRSGNRAYDESIARALRSIDALPPIPASLNTDLMEVGFNFHPPGETR